MFCLARLMDCREYPASGLAACTGGGGTAETALREAKAGLRGAGPSAGPMLAAQSPDLVRQELAAWAAATEMTRGVARAAALAASPAKTGRRAGMPVQAREISHARTRRAVTAAIRTGRTSCTALARELSRYRTVIDRKWHRVRKAKCASTFPAAAARTLLRGSPRPSSPSPIRQPDQRKHREASPRGSSLSARGTGRHPARHAGLQHARSQELPRTKRIRSAWPSHDQASGSLLARRTAGVFVCVMIAASVFWATATVAQWSGRGLAEYAAVHFDALPSVILDTKEQLWLHDPSVVKMTQLPRSQGQTFHYRYRGLRLLIVGQDRMFLVPKVWSSSDSTLIVPLDGTMRVQFQFENQAP